MVLFTGGAVLIGVILVAFVMLSSGQLAPATIKAPVEPTPQSAWDGRAIGAKDAPLTLEVFSDFQCPACDAFTTQTEPQLVKDYVLPGKLRIVYKDFSFIGQESLDAAIGARCAADQGLFWPMHDYLFANQNGENKGGFNRPRLLALGAAAGVDAARFSACLDAKPGEADVKAETAEGQAKGVTSTPTLFINGRAVAGALERPYYDYAVIIERHAHAPHGHTDS